MQYVNNCENNTVSQAVTAEELSAIIIRLKFIEQYCGNEKSAETEFTNINL